MGDSDSEVATKPLIGDLAGVGEIVKSRVARQAYNESLSPAMKQVGGLTEDAAKTFRLFTAPLQLAAAYQDRFASFCERVRSRVPKEHQRDAAPEIARPVMEALESTGDESELMSLFEELMSQAIDKRKADRLSPEFSRVIKSLSPLEALLLKRLKYGSQVAYQIIDQRSNSITQWLSPNFNMRDYGGESHYLTISQVLVSKGLVTDYRPLCDDMATRFPELIVPERHRVYVSSVSLSMYGRWFAKACIPAH